MSDTLGSASPLVRRRSRLVIIVAITGGAIALAAFLDDVFVADQTWRYGAPGIARDANEPARSIASEFWPFARAICANPAVSAAEINEQNPVSDYLLWNGGYNLVRRSGLIELHQRRLYGHRWDRGWMLQSMSTEGDLDIVEVERPRLGPDDSPAPSTHAIYDGDCRLIGASYYALSSESERVWEWRRVCFGPGWVESDCEALQEQLDRFVVVWSLSFDAEEKHCFDGTWTQTVGC